MISFPRDIVDIPLGNGLTWRQKINGIPYFKGEATMKAALAATLKQPIDYYVEINMGDFMALVNAIGGVDVKVPKTIIDPSIRLLDPGGEQHLNGTQALGFARSRHTTSDWDRAARQQLLVAAIIRTMVDPQTQINFLGLLDSLKSMQTDLPLDRFAGLFELARDAKGATVSMKVLAPPQFARLRRDRAGDRTRLHRGAEPVGDPRLCGVGDGELRSEPQVAARVWRVPQWKQLSSAAWMVVPQFAQSTERSPSQRGQ